MDPKIRTALRMPGGKSKVIKKYIDPFIPEFEGSYYEPFLGGGSVALWMAQKFSKKTIFVNDLNYNLYCFWKILQAKPNELIQELHFIRNSHNPNDFYVGKALLSKMKDKMEYESDAFEIAVAFYVLNKISFSGLTENCSITQHNYKYIFNNTNIDKLNEVSFLMKNMYLSNLDYKEFLSDSSKEDFIFLDPPYEIDEKLYGKDGEFQTGFDHNEFANFIKSLKSKWMITYNDSDIIRERFKDYNIYDREYKYCMAFEIDENGNKNTRKRNELIITNYD